MSVVMLAGPGESTWIVANALREELPLHTVIVEEPVSSWQLMKRRASKIGWIAVAGQALFSIYARRLRSSSRARAAAIRRENGLQSTRPASVQVVHVRSANDDETIRLLQKLAPKVVVVNGTRILSKRLLESVDAIFLNMHVGITPKYRGVHGGYWALAQGDLENAGVTVHLVNTGIDTGGVVYQARIHPAPEDNFITYPALQVAAGVRLMKQAVRDALNGTLRVQQPDLPSRLYYLPTIWQYWWTRHTTGVR